MIGSAVIAISGFLSGFSPNFSWLLVFRGLVGFGVGMATKFNLIYL
jgi:MFS family permease